MVTLLQQTGVSAYSIPRLAISPTDQALADFFAVELKLPNKAHADALHLAIASTRGMKYLLTWNCRHLANGFVRDTLSQLGVTHGLTIPNICTPEEL